MLAEELPHLYLCFSSSLGVAMRLISSQNTLEHICPLTHATAANSFSPYFWRALIAAIVHFVWLFALFSSIPLLLMLGDSFQKTAYECKELKSCIFGGCFLQLLKRFCSLSISVERDDFVKPICICYLYFSSLEMVHPINVIHLYGHFRE